MRVAALTAAALIFSALSASAQIAQNWNGSVNTDWFNAGNWDSTTAPATGDSVTIDTVTPNPTVMTGGTADLNGLNVGYTGTGSLTADGTAAITITNNSLVIGGDLIGTFASANGTLVLDNATLTVTGSPPGSGTIFVGASGVGAFTAQNGSTVDTVDSYVGHLAGASGTVTVDNSTWTNSGSSYIGNFSTGVFNVLNAGAVSVAGDTIVGANTTGNGTINISDAGSSWTTDGYTILGGNLLTPVGGTGTINVSNGGAYTANDQMFVGLVGTGAVNVTGGGQLTTADSVFLGFSSGATGTVTVSGAGSTWTANGGVTIVGGNDGSLPVGGNGTINVLNSATFDSTSGDVVLGNDPSETSRGTVSVSGATWNASGIFVGESGNGTVNITNAATVTADILIAGDCSCSHGIINVSGGSTLAVTSDVNLGFDGVGTMNVSGGGTAVTVGGDMYLGLAPGSTGTLNVSDATASVTLTGDLYAGYAGTGTANVQNGAALTATNAFIGAIPGANGTVNVSGTGSTLIVNDSVLIGIGGVGTGALNVFDGGVANVTNTVFNGDRVLVGAGSIINAGGYSATPDATTTIGLRGATSGRIDLGGGTAALDGALVITGHNQAATSYTLVHSGDLGGTVFSSVVYQDALQNPVLTYTAGEVLLTVDAFVLAASSNLGKNQTNVAQAIDSALASGGTLLGGLNDLFNLSGGALNNGLAAVAGLPGAAAIQSGIHSTNTFINTIFDTAFGGGGVGGGPLGYASEKKVSREAADAYAAVTPRDRRAAPFTARWNVWVTGYGGYSKTDGSASAGTADTTSRVWGLIAGAEYRFSPDTKAGLVMGGSTSNFDVSGGFGNGSADAFNLAIYGKHQMGAAYLAGALGYSLQAAKTKRVVTIAGTDVLEADFTANIIMARLEGGYRFAMSPINIAPYAALQSTTFFLPSYGEHATAGLPAFALSYDSEAITATRTELGTRLEKAFATGEGTLTLKSKLAWAHDWNTDQHATATFQTLPGATFTVNGAEPSANSALVSLGAEYAWGNGWSFAAKFDGEFSSTTSSYAGKGTLRYQW